MPSTPWELYEAEAPSPSEVKRALTFIFAAILVVGILVSTFLGA